MDRNIIFLFSIIIFSCKSDVSVSFPETKISFTVDSMRVYSAEQISQNDFIFSPLTNFDKIWTINTGNIHELDLVTGAWKALSDKYDKGFKGNTREKYIWKDLGENEVFISLFHDGLLYFDLDRDTFYRFEINPVTSLVNSKDRIIVGTAKGHIFTIDKSHLKDTLEPSFCDSWITKLEVLNKDSLSINDGKEFHEMNLVGFKKGNYPASLTPWLYDRNDVIAQRLPGAQYKTFKDSHLKWHFSPKYLFVSDTFNNIYKFQDLPARYLRQVKNDDKYLYLLFKNKFVILNKTYILKKATLFDINAFQVKKIRLQNIINSFYKLEVDSFLQTYYQIKSDTSLIATPENAERFKNASRSYFSLFHRNIKRLSDVENALSDNLFPVELEPYALLGVSMYYLQKYNTPKFNFFSSQLVLEYPEFDGGWYQGTIECSSRIIAKIDSLSKLYHPKDEFLYEEAQLKMKLVNCGAFGDTYYNYSIVDDSYKLLLLKFPTSQYADNAEFYFLQSYFEGYEVEWTYSEELESKIQKFILKYPNSELKAKARRFLTLLYTSYEGSQNKKIEFLEKGLTELENIDLQNIRDSVLISYIAREKLIIQKDIAKEIFDFTVSPIKKYKLDDKEMLFKVVLKNKTTETRPLKLFPGDSPFGIFFYSKNDYQFEENSIEGDSIAMTKLIPPNDSIVHYVNLRSNVRNIEYNDGESVGGFSFKMPGFYYFSVASADKILRSEQIEFYIYEN